MSQTGGRPALVLTTGYEEYQRSLVRGAYEVLGRHGPVLVINALNDFGRLSASIEHLIRQLSPYGALTTSFESPSEDDQVTSLLADLGLPMVRLGVHTPGVTAVCCDDATGMHALMAHLLDDCGVRRPAFARGMPHHSDSIRREQVFRQALAARGLAVDEDLLFDGMFFHETTYRQLHALLERRRDFDAVVACNDVSALGAVAALHDAGLAVPGDVLVTGFDNSRSAVTWPELTTVDPRLELQGATAARRLLAELDGAPPVPEVLVPSRLVIRGSTRLGGLDSADRARAAERMAHSAREQLTSRDTLWALSLAMAHCDSLDALATTMTDSNLSRLGVRRCFVVVYTEDASALQPGTDGPRARLLAGFTGGRAVSEPAEEFPGGALLPTALRGELAAGLLVVQPLFHGRREFGYLLLDQQDASVTVSDALKLDLSRTLDRLFSTRALQQQARQLQATVQQLQEQIEERARAEAQLQLSTTAFDQAADGIVIVDSRARMISVNPAFAVTSGFSAEELLGRPVSLLRPRGRRTGTYRVLRDTLSKQGHWEGELACRRKNGEEFIARISVSAVRTTDADAGKFVITCNDVTELRRMDERIRMLAFHDGLTGLPNRALLVDRLSQALALAQRAGEPLVTLFVDLDRFKTINDSFGHEVGNEALRQSTQRLVGHLRESDTVARVGPDHFVVLLANGSAPQGAAVVAAGLIAHLSQSMRIDGHLLRVGASIGIANYPEDGGDPTELLRNAEAAVRSAKHAGGGTYRFFRPEMTTRAQQQLQLEMELRDAVDNGGLELFYQPKIGLSDGSLHGAEALVRWRHPDRGLLAPIEFIPLAEERGIITQLGDWVLDEACRQARRWQLDRGRRVRVGINCSAIQTRQTDLVKDILRSCATHGLEPADLELELTETGIMENLADVSPTFASLRDVGVTIAIDDFGTGYSGFAYLRDLPVDVLKIDRSFIMNAESKPQDRKILSTIVALGHALGLEIVAEGVETRYQADLLLSFGCRVAQGYLFARPMPAAQFEQRYLTGA